MTYIYILMGGVRLEYSPMVYLEPFVHATTIVTRGKVSIKKKGEVYRGSIKTGLEATGDACPPIPLFGRER